MTKTRCHLAGRPQPFPSPPPPVFTPHRLSHHKPACQGCHTALLNLQKAGVVKCLQAFGGFTAMGVSSGVELTAAAVSCLVQDGLGKPRSSSAAP